MSYVKNRHKKTSEELLNVAIAALAELAVYARGESDCTDKDAEVMAVDGLACLIEIKVKKDLNKKNTETEVNHAT